MHRRSALPLLVLFLVFAAVNLPAQIFTQPDTGTAGTWSAGPWSPAAPVSSASTVLQFFTQGGNASAFTFTNDLGPFTANHLVFGNSGTGLFSTALGGNVLTMGGSGPVLESIGPGNVDITGSAGLMLTAAETDFVSSGNGYLRISAPIAGGAGAVLGVVQSGNGIAVLAGTNTFPGGVFLGGGALQLANASGLGSGPLTVGGGVLRFSTTATISNPITANANVVIAPGTGALTATNTPTLTGLISGNGGLVVLPFGSNAGVNLQAANTYTGATALRSAIPNSTQNAGTFTLSGTNGAILNSSAITVGKQAVLNIGAGGSTNANRIADTIPLTVENGTINYVPVTAGTTEVLGNLTVAGGMRLGTTAAGVSSLQFGSFARDPRAILWLTSNSFGTVNSAATATRVTFASGLSIADNRAAGSGSGTETGVLPFAVAGSSTNPQNFVTYDATNGLTVLPVANTSFVVTSTRATFAADLAAGNLTNKNVRLNGGGTYDLGGTTATFNALATTLSTVTITNGTINLFSGALVNFDNVIWDTGATLHFPSTGYIHQSFHNVFRSTSTITGSNGVVVGGYQAAAPGVATFENTPGNPFTGGLFVNGLVAVSFRQDNQLGAAGEPITLSGGGLVYNAAADLEISRALTLNGTGYLSNNLVANGGTTGNATATTRLTLSGTISGGGALIKEGLGITNLTGTNSYVGGTVVSAGTLQFTADANLGQSGAHLTLNGGTLQPLAAVTLSRPIDFNNNSAIKAEADLTLAGELKTVGSLYGSALPTVTKTGAGTLAVVSNSPLLSGILSVVQGGLAVRGLGNLGQISGVNLAEGTTFTLDNTAAYLSSRFSNRGSVNFTGAAVARYLAPVTATTDPAERFGPLTANAAGAVFSVTGSTASPTILRFSSVKSSGSLTLRGTDLGGTTGNYTRILFDTPPVANGALIPNVFFANTAGTGPGTIPAQWDNTRGVIAFVPVPASGTTIDNFAPASTPTSAAFTTTGDATANTGAGIFSLTLDGGSGLTLVDGANPPSATNLNTATGTLALFSGLLTSQNGAKMIGSAAARTLDFGGTAALVTTVSDLTLAANVTTANAVSLTKAGAGNLTLNGPFTVTGPVNVAVGTITFGAPVTLANLSGAGAINAGANPLTVNSTSATTFGGSLTAGMLIKTGPGVFTLTLANAATYTGSTTIGQGTLLLGDAATALVVLGNFTLGSGATSGTLDLNGFSPSAPLTALNVGGGTGNRIINSNPVTTSTIDLALLADTTFAGGFGGNLVVNKNDAFLLSLTGTVQPAAVPSELIKINAGTLRIQTDAPLSPGAAFSIASGARLDFGTFGRNDTGARAFGPITCSSGAITVTGGDGDLAVNQLIFTGGSLDTTGTGICYIHLINPGAGITTNASSSTVTFTGPTTGSRLQNDTLTPLPITIAAGNTPSGIDLEASLLLSDADFSTNPGFLKQGPGLMQISYPGVTTGNFQIAEGTLQIAAGANLTGTAVVNGGVLQGVGTQAGEATVNGGGRIRAGTLASPAGTLSLGSNLIVTNGGSIQASISRTGAGTAASGLLQLANATGELRLAPAAGNTFAIDLVADPAHPLVPSESYTVTLAKAAAAGKFLLNGSVLADGPIAAANYTVTANGFNVAQAIVAVSGDSLTLSFVVPTVPMIDTPFSTGVTATGATLGGNVASDGQSPILERGIVYSRVVENSDPFLGGTGVTKVVGNGTTGFFAVEVTGLQHGRQYIFRPYATNSVGTASTANPLTFTTTNVAPLAPNASVRATPGDRTTITLPFPGIDAEGDMVTLVSAGTASHLQINSVDGRNITFTPEAGFIGDGSFSYTVSDGTEAANANATGTVLVKIASAPVKGGTLPGGGILSALTTPQTGAFLGTVQVGKVKSPALFAADGTVLLQVGVNGVSKIGALSGDAVLVTLKTGGTVTAKNNVQLMNGLDAEAPAIAAQTGTTYPSLPAGVTISKFLQIDGQGSTTFALVSLVGPGLNAATNLALCAIPQGGPPKIVAQKGRDVTIGLNTRSITTLATLVASKGSLAANRWRIDDSNFGIRVSFPDKQQAIFAVPASAATSADWTLLNDTSIPPIAGTTAISFGLPGFGLSSAAQATNLAPGSGISAANNRILTVGTIGTGLFALARTGDGTGDSTGVSTPEILLATLADPLSGANRAVAYTGTLKGTGVKPASSSGLFFAADGVALSMIARTGDLAPGTGNAHWLKFSTLALPTDATRGPIFLATLAPSVADSVTAKNNLGLWAVDSTGTLQLLLRSGNNHSLNGVTKIIKTFTTLIPVAGTTGAASGYDNQGHVAALITFTDGTLALRVLTIP